MMNDLKYEALLEGVAKQAARYEDALARARAELTTALQDNEDLLQVMKDKDEYIRQLEVREVEDS